MKNQGWLIICLLSLAFSSSTMAQELYPFFRGVRQMGMGGASVATVNDSTALFLNPAGLGKIRGPIITLFDAEMESTPDTYSVYMSQPAQGKSFTDPQQLLTIMSDPTNQNRHLHARAQVFPSIVTTNFGLGLFGKYTMDAEMERGVAVPTYMRVHYINDYGANMGYTLRLFDGRIKIGVSGKVVNRVEIDQDIPTTATGLTMQSLASEGAGVGCDAGIILTGPWAWLPTIAATTNDVGDTSFKLGNGYFYKTGRYPRPQKQVTTVGVAVFPIHGKRFRSSWTAEYRDVQNPDSVDPYKRVHGGVEFNYADVIFLRGGMNQRYWTAGVELAISMFQLQAASYGEDIGPARSPIEDRRYIMQMALRF